MVTWLFGVERIEYVLLWTAIELAVLMIALVVVERLAYALSEARQRRIEQRYSPLIRRAMDGDDAALGALADTPRRHQIAVARLLIMPLIADRDPARIARTRAVVEAMSLIPLAVRYVRSRRWWLRTIGLRALGLLQATAHTAAIVAALDDVNSDVRAAALDALTDLRDPATLPAIVVRLHDTSLHRGRRIAALTAFGSQCESFLLDLSAIDDEHLVNYARALGVCGTAESRGTLTRWTEDPRADVRTAALEALARIGLDGNAARHAVDALDSADVPVRAMAAHALRGWPAAGTVAPRLARHLDDAWPVAVHAARSLQSMGEAGRLELQARAGGSDLAGRLARQMMWQGVMR